MATAARFWKPGTVAPGSSVVREDVSDIGGGLLAYTAQPATVSMKQQRLLLPIAGHRSQLLYALETHQVLIMVGETGSGTTRTQKTTTCTRVRGVV